MRLLDGPIRLPESLILSILIMWFCYIFLFPISGKPTSVHWNVRIPGGSRRVIYHRCNDVIIRCKGHRITHIRTKNWSRFDKLWEFQQKFLQRNNCDCQNDRCWSEIISSSRIGRCKNTRQKLSKTSQKLGTNWSFVQSSFCSKRKVTSKMSEKRQNILNKITEHFTLKMSEKFWTQMSEKFWNRMSKQFRTKMSEEFWTKMSGEF